jgi:hypothetical protein
LQRDDVANAVSDVAVGKNVEPHTNPISLSSHLFECAHRASHKIAQATEPLFEPFVYLLPPTRAAEFCVRPFFISILIPVVTECATAAD